MVYDNGEQSKMFRVKCRRDGELYGGRRPSWSAMEDLHPLLHIGRFHLLYAASILGWVNGCIGFGLPRLVFP